ncbi:MAG: VWA domain-containing protein [Arenicellales bacterium]
MEEFIGKIWHRYISQRAQQDYPEAAINLDEIRFELGLFFRALGGEGGLRIEEALETDNYARRSLMQRVAGEGKRNSLAWRDDETLRLPNRIALFSDNALNYDLYLWLAAISSSDVEQTFWLASNQQRSLQTLEAWPGLTKVYSRLVEAHILQRPSPEGLPTAEANQEQIIQAALRQPERAMQFKQAAKKVPQAVPLWLHPSPPEMSMEGLASQHDPDQPESQKTKPADAAKKRKQGEHAQLPTDKGGLLSFRLETLWSWSEYIKVDRSTTESDDDDATKTAEDMDSIAVAQDSEAASSKIKIDLDLPSGEYDDIVLGEGIPIDEWNYKTQVMQKDYCRLQPMIVRHAGEQALPSELKIQARKIRQQFEMLRPERQWVSRQAQGSEIDLESYVSYLSDRKHGQVNNDQLVYRQARQQHRDLACLLLADLSLSTEAYINNDKRVIDVIRNSVYLFSEALSATGDQFAVHGFSSRNRNHVRFYDIKAFDAPYDEVARGRINALKPGYYTRMGAAIRHASKLLGEQGAKQKLLLLLTDGKPNDLDQYEGRYGLEDTRMAVLEAQALGIQPFCITIDQQAEDYLPYLFGKQSFMLVRHAKDLPQKLPLLYLRLTR